MSAVGRGSFVDADSGDSNSMSDPIHEATTVTPFGKIKTFAGLEKDEWLFLTISTVNILVAIGLTIERLVDLKKDSVDFTFAIILFINTVLCLFYAIHGVLREREFEIYGYMAAVAVLVLYIILDLAINPNRTPIKWIRFAVLVFFAPFNVWYGYKVVKGFGYLEFKTVGAAVALQKMYRQAGIFTVLLEFDFQLAISLIVLALKDTTALSLEQKMVVAVGVPVQVLWAFIGWVLLSREIRHLMWLFILISLAEPAYIIYGIAKIADDWENNKNILAYSFIGGGILALIIRMLVFVAMKFVISNFGQGLREMVFALPVSDDQPPLLPRKRDIAKCCGIVCCGPIG